jgi:hypothetical protein
MRPRVLWLIIGATVVASLSLVRAQTAAPPPPAPTAPGAPTAAPTAPSAPPSDTVKIVFLTVPMKKAFVFWGKKRLGVIAPHQPLVIQRPRDSGPLDVVIRADGYVTVQTRAYTFADAKVAVKLTPLDQKKTILGYREEVPPEPDGGVPPPLPGSAVPPAPTRPMSPDAGAR